MKLFIQDLKNILINVGNGFIDCMLGLGQFIMSLCYLILFIPIQMCLSIYYVCKYIFYNRRRVMTANRQGLMNILAPHTPTKYYCLGLRLNNHLVAKLARKRLETI